MMPPSPRLSARMISITYLSDTTIISDQNIIDRPARMFSCVERDAVRRGERFLHRVQRAGADVAEHHAEREQRQAELCLFHGGRSLRPRGAPRARSAAIFYGVLNAALALEWSHEVAGLPRLGTSGCRRDRGVHAGGPRARARARAGQHRDGVPARAWCWSRCAAGAARWSPPRSSASRRSTSSSCRRAAPSTSTTRSTC